MPLALFKVRKRHNALVERVIHTSFSHPETVATTTAAPATTAAPGPVVTAAPGTCQVSTSTSTSDTYLKPLMHCSKKYSCLALLTDNCFQCGVKGGAANGRIVGGQETEQHEYPWQVKKTKGLVVHTSTIFWGKSKDGNIF